MLDKNRANDDDDDGMWWAQILIHLSCVFDRRNVNFGRISL